jgi:hypothetical protein
MNVIAENIGEDTSYLTAGREYQVVATVLDGEVLTIIDDEGDSIDIRIDGCMHIGGHTWMMVETGMDKQAETVSRTVYVMRSKAGDVSIETETGLIEFGWKLESEHEITLPVKNASAKAIEYKGES